MINELMSNQDLVYNILETKYVKSRGRKVSIDPRANQDLYPAGWFSNGNLIKKSNILAEAIEKKCLIIETEGYAEIQEGVKKKDYKEEER